MKLGSVSSFLTLQKLSTQLIMKFCLIKGIGGVWGQIWDLSDSYSPSTKFSDAFYGIEKACSVVKISRDEFLKNAKILYILRIFKFSIDDISQFLIFGPKSVSRPHIWPSCCILWVIQTLFGNF